MPKTETQKPEVRNAKLRLQKHFTKPSLTQQQFKDDAIIRNVISKYDHDDLLKLKQQALDMTGGDYTEIDEFAVARSKVQQAEAWFHKLPSHIRRHFDEDPGTAIEFMSNPANADALVKMGLAEAPLPPQPTPEPVDNGSQKPVDTPKADKGDTPTPEKPEA